MSSVYHKAIQFIPDSFHQMIDLSKEMPWEEIENDMMTSLVQDDKGKEATARVAGMADGMIVSMTIEAGNILKSGRSEQEIMALTAKSSVEIASLAIIRAFAMGVWCQRQAAEVAELESLAAK